MELMKQINSMKKILIVLLVLLTRVDFAVGQNVVFEQSALDYFADSIVNKKDPFNNMIIHFTGNVDSSITTIQYEMTQFFPNDTLLYAEYKKTLTATSGFWRGNNKAPFKLEIKDPVIGNEKRKYGKNSKVIRLMVFQNKTVGDKNYVWIRGFTGSGYTGHDIYFIMNSDGRVIKWYKSSFIF